ncbi:MAG: hypothetical protein JRI39_06225 [Deltaproteobacteria bacterium]|nr:hypothetical protein [Deltaproteobacteria bacterium]
MFVIQTKDLKLILEAAPVSSLRTHERVIPEAAEKLLLQLKNWAHLHNPIICGTNNIILDGHHRTFAFKKLGFLFIPVCKIDYMHKDTQVRCWFRLLTNVKDINLLVEVFRGHGAIVKPVGSKEELKQELDRSPLSFGLQQVEKIQTKIRGEGINTEYVPCEVAEERNFCNGLSDREVVVWTPQISKEMVEDAVKQNRCFAPKTTRHVIPARPINVNVPISWFREDTSLEELDKRFTQFLKSKTLMRLPPGQTIDGRYYEEELFVFMDKKG